MPSALLLGELTPPYNHQSSLERGVEIIREPGLLSPQTLVERLSRDPMIEGVICSLDQQVTRQVFESVPQLKIISNIAVGLNNIDLEAARQHQVRVAHTPHVLTDATADLAWALLLGVSRRLVEADQLARSGRWQGWEMGQLLGRAVGASGVHRQQRLGIIGLGEIGQAVAKRAVGFNMEVCYYSRARKQELEETHGWSYLTIDELLTSSDHIILALALCSETHHFINRDRLSLMKSDATLINIGRGPLIDEKALIDVLSSGRLGGAGLDVFEREPIVPEQLRVLPNVILTPHIGSATLESRKEMSRLAIDSTMSILLGEEPRGYFAV